MAYQIDRYNNTILTVVEDGTVDTTTDLKFIGKNYAGYGEIQNENFLFLLENFSGANPPPRAISGQVWFDSANSKLKFFDGSSWRSTGGSEVSDTEPSGLSVGDFWWDSANNQLYVWNGTAMILIGPQAAGEGVTRMLSDVVLDTTNTPHNIIKAVVGDEVIYIISATEFTLAAVDTIPGFDRIKKGLTLVNTKLATNGVTSTDHYYWGTASNALKLGGVDAANYVRNDVPAFDQLANFSDAGLTIGNGNELKIYIDRVDGSPTQNHGVIQHDVGTDTKISFYLNNSSGGAVNPLTLDATGLIPAGDNSFYLGNANRKFNTVYATTFSGLATSSSALTVGGQARTASTSALPNTIAARDSSGNLAAVEFQGTATSAKYADLAEKYATDQEYPVGTVIAVGGDAEARAAKVSDHAIGVISAEPAYMMNSEAEGQYVGLKGRVPVRVNGPVSKGQAVYAWQDGVASTIASTGLVGVALETNNDEGEKLVECVLKV